MRAYRAGTVALANAVGTGVADDKAIYHWVPEMIRFYLGEEPLLENVKTYLMSDPEAMENALRRMDELVFKPTGESGGKGVFIGSTTDPIELAGLADVIRRSPEKWIAQELVSLSTVPTADEHGNLAPRHVDLRPFAVFGETISIVPGGLSRVALVEGSMIVNSSRGGRSKDTWVLENGEDHSDRAMPSRPESLPPALPDLRYGSWTGQVQQHSSSSARPDRPGALLARSQPRARRVDVAPAGGRLSRRPPGPPGGPGRDATVLGLAHPHHGRASGATTVRDVISTEMWEAINTTYLRLPDGDLPQPVLSAPIALYQHVKERSALF